MRIPALLENWWAKVPVPRVFRPARPIVALELTDQYLAAARAGSEPGELGAYFQSSVPAGSVRTSPVHQNILSREKLLPLIRAARDRVAPAGAPVALCLPDAIVRLTVITTEAMPATQDKIAEMVSWRVKKSIPFRMEEARLAWEIFPAHDGKQSLVAATLRQRVVEEYESLLAEEGLNVGAVTTSSLALGERLPAAPDGDALLINVGCGWFSILITDGHELVFHRCKPLPEGERHGAERDWFVAGELFPTVEYYSTKLNRPGLKSCYLHVSGPGWDDLHETLRTTVDIPGLLPASRVPGLALGGLAPEVRDSMAAVAALATRANFRENTATSLAEAS